ncbi:MAG TPA: DUF222 domain-containing protein [Actinomycetes bacterium]|nr:DUF222 domain-containing protein [Actinomycetes bacterium]
MPFELSPPTGLRPRPAPDAPRIRALVDAIDVVLDAPADATLPAAALGDEILVLQRQINRLSAGLLARLAAFDAVDGAHVIAGASTASWLRHRTGLPAGQSSDLVRTARALRDSLVDTRAALQRGDLTTQHARTIVRTVGQVTDAVVPEHQPVVAHEVEAVMLGVGCSVDAGSLTGFGHRVRQIADPEGVLSDANRAYERRWFTASRTLDGMVNVEGLLDPQSGATVLTLLAAGSVPTGPGDTRSSGQRRADALVEMCRQALDRGDVAATGGISPHLLVTTSLAALQGAAAKAQQDSAELEWVGPVPAETARRLACDATLSRVLIDPAGLPLDVGRATRVVPPAIRAALVIRDGGCVADCCDRPPPWTEAHHIQHWIDGGATSLENLVLLCRTHHRKVHEQRWQLRRSHDQWSLVPP